MCIRDSTTVNDASVRYRVRFQSRRSSDDLERARRRERTCNCAVEQRPFGGPRLPILAGDPGDELVRIKRGCACQRKELAVARVHYDCCTLVVSKKPLARLLQTGIDGQDDTLSRHTGLFLQRLHGFAAGIHFDEFLTLLAAQQRLVLQLDAFLADYVLHDVAVSLQLLAVSY